MPRVSKKYKNITVVADKRERSVTKEYSDLIVGEPDSNNTIVHLRNKVITVGDFMIGVEVDHVPSGKNTKTVASTDDDEIQFAEVHAIIERKTYEDYAASIKDNRMENTEKLLAARQQLNCTVFYVIEGTGSAAKYGGIPIKNIMSNIFNLQMQYGISILYTKSAKHTAQTIGLLSRSIVNMLNREKVHARILFGKGTNNGDVNDDINVTNSNDDNVTQTEKTVSITGGRVTKSREKTWCKLFDGVGPKLAKVLSETYTISQLCCGIDEETLKTDMKGTRISKKLIGAISTLPTTVNGDFLVNSILSSITGISNATAAALIEKMGGVKITAKFFCCESKKRARKFASEKFKSTVSEGKLTLILDWLH